MTHLTITDIANKNDEPRIEDLRLARLLGFGNTYDFRKLVRRHEKGLEKFGKLVFATVAKTAVTKGGRPGKGYWLNEKQALYICTKSEAPNAVDITIEMVEVFHDFKTGRTKSLKPATPKALPKTETLTEAQKSTIQAMILARFPNKNRREWAYMALKAHFKVSRYAFIPKTEYIEALSFISNLTEERIHDLIMSALFDSDEIRAYRIDHKMREGVERRLHEGRCCGLRLAHYYTEASRGINRLL